MRALLIWPKFAPSFFSFTSAHELLGKKAVYAPLSLATVAALLPQNWDIRIRDCNIDPVSEEEWQWSEMVLVSGMITQQKGFCDLIAEAKQRGKMVAVGGPFATSVPEAPIGAGADFLVLDEGEITIPLFLAALERGERSGRFSAAGEKADMTRSPVPRFELLDMDNYLEMSIQFSRGCPYLCEFCDIPGLYGRQPRTKTPQQFLTEIQRLLDLGWSKALFVADDNFIGNKKYSLQLLKEVKVWQEKNGYPLGLSCEASLNLADDERMLSGMRDAGFRTAFMGVETPDLDSLANIKKTQNCRHSMIDRIHRTYEYGIRITAGFIVGFDGEKKGADQRIVEFVEQSNMPLAMVNMLYALPNTPLIDRLKAQNRMHTGYKENSITGGHLTNFVMTRPIEEVVQEYVDCLQTLYEHERFLDRLYRHCMLMGEVKKKQPRFLLRDPLEIRALFIVLWRHGYKRVGRGKFWRYAWDIFKNKRRAFRRYLSVCGQYEHFYAYGQEVEETVKQQLVELGDLRDQVFDVNSTPEAVEVPITIKNADAASEVASAASSFKAPDPFLVAEPSTV